MDDAKADILMYFMTDKGAIDGESNLQIDPSDGFMDGFKATSYRNYANFFEITEFNFNLRLNAGEKDGANLKKDSAMMASVAAAANKVGFGGPTAKTSVKKEPDEYDKWRSATAEELKILKFPVEFGTFTFKRTLDAASPIFFQNCANAISFESAVMVKRLQAASGSGQGFTSQGYMRIEFTDVLLTKVSWEDGDIVKENCEFKCKKMDVKYKRQNMDGSLSSVVSHAAWDQVKNGKPPGAADSQETS